MNELFTLLIILAAIISFINKILSDRKKTASSRQRPGTTPEPREWIPPWLEPEEHEFLTQKRREIEIDREEKSESKPISTLVTEKRSGVTPAIAQEIYKPVESKIEVKSSRPVSKELERLEIKLSSSDELKKGIILAEILGTCKGKKNWRGMKYR